MTSPAPRSPRSSYLVFGSPQIGEDAIAEVVDSLRSGWLGTGPKVARFERMLEDYVGVPHARALGSCSMALALALRVIGVGAGDEVIVPAMTFAATVNAIEHAGARPVLVDCEPGTGLLDLEAAQAAISPRTVALIAVHLCGRPLDMQRLNALRDRNAIAVVEDAAHALGARWGRRPIGSHGNLTAFSFHVTKNITTIEGGALMTDDSAVAERVERLALHGLSAGAWERFSDAGHRHYEVVEPGFKFNMTDVQAAVGLHQLPMLDSWIDRRAELWQRYDERLADLPLQRPLAPEAGTRHARHLYTVAVTAAARRSRDELLQALHEARIGAGVHYRAVHLQPYYRDRYEIAPEDLPVATSISQRTLSLPLGPQLGDDDVDDVVDALRRALAA
ncbi:MAG: DegT/DnrJ/EryC1/StrS family aminotransferase [Thermoleophilia bacterium]